MDTENKSNTAEGINGQAPAPAAKKPAAPGKLPSKPISFSNQTIIKNGKKVKATVDKSKKSGHLMKKLTGK
jgi:hypothetical protein